MRTCSCLKERGYLIFSHGFANKEFSARKWVKGWLSKMKATNESMRVTKKVVYVWNGKMKIILKKLESNQKVTGDEWS